MSYGELFVPISQASDQHLIQEQILSAAVREFGDFNVERLHVEVPHVTVRAGRAMFKIGFSIDPSLTLCPLCEGRGLIEHKEQS
jgi:hypothetical protein